MPLLTVSKVRLVFLIFQATQLLKPSYSQTIINITDSEGTIETPNYPDNYPADIEIRWHITTPNNTRIVVWFNETIFDIEFELDCEFDYLKILDGGNLADEKFLDRNLCGTVSPRSFESSSNEIIVVFFSDVSDTGKGFQLFWNTTTDCNASELRCWDGTCINNFTICDGVFDCPNDFTDESFCAEDDDAYEACGRPNFNATFKWPSPRIIGGQIAEVGSWPWIVAVVKDGETRAICGGSIIGTSWVLTAAHCFDTLSYLSITLYAGEHDVSNPTNGNEQASRVKKAYIHEEYQIGKITFGFDITLLELETPFVYNKFVQPICYYEDPIFDPTPGSVCVTAGWGLTSTTSSSILRQVSVPLINPKTCFGVFQQFLPATSDTSMPESQFCAGDYENGKADGCQGDSGGPIVCMSSAHTWYQIGVVSYGAGCGLANYPGFYTRVSSYYDWILNITSPWKTTTLAGNTAKSVVISTTIATPTPSLFSSSNTSVELTTSVSSKGPQNTSPKPATTSTTNSTPTTNLGFLTTASDQQVSTFIPITSSITTKDLNTTKSTITPGFISAINPTSSTKSLVYSSTASNFKTSEKTKPTSIVTGTKESEVTSPLASITSESLVFSTTANSLQTTLFTTTQKTAIVTSKNLKTSSKTAVESEQTKETPTILTSSMSETITTSFFKSISPSSEANIVTSVKTDSGVISGSTVNFLSSSTMRDSQSTSPNLKNTETSETSVNGTKILTTRTQQTNIVNSPTDETSPLSTGIPTTVRISKLTIQDPTTVTTGIFTVALSLTGLSASAVVIKIIAQTKNMLSDIFMNFILSLALQNILSSLFSPLTWYIYTIDYVQFNLPPQLCNINWMATFTLVYVAPLQILSFSCLKAINFKYSLTWARINRNKAVLLIACTWLACGFIGGFGGVFFFDVKNISNKNANTNRPCSIRENRWDSYYIYTCTCITVLLLVPSIAVLVSAVTVVHWINNKTQLKPSILFLSKQVEKEHRQNNSKEKSLMICLAANFVLGYIPLAVQMVLSANSENLSQQSRAMHHYVMATFLIRRCSECVNLFLFMAFVKTLKVNVLRIFSVKNSNMVEPISI